MTPLCLILIFIFGCASPQKHPKITCYQGTTPIKASVVNSKSFYPEAPLWHNDRLYYVEYSKNRVMEWTGDKNAVIWEQTGCGPSGLVSTSDGLWVACYDANSILRLKLGKTVEVVEKLSPFHGANDFALDSVGGIYFTASGIFDVKSPIEGKVYYLDRQHRTQLVAENIHYANGIAVINRGRTLVVSEHLKNRVLGFTITSPGIVDEKSRRVLVDLNSIPLHTPDLSQGLLGPDGIRLAPDGHLYVAQYGGSRVLKFKISDTGDLSLAGILSFTSSYPNTDNVWINEEGRIFGTAVQEKAEANYPGIVYFVDGKKLSSQQPIECRL